VAPCNACGALATQQPCPLCASPARANGLLCVVERPTDVLNIEKSNTFNRRYHVLGGRISPLDGVGPEDLRIDSLLGRLSPETIAEVILALGSDVEGEATTTYLARRLNDHGVRVSRIAQGLPAGTGLEHADDLTLARALEGRRPVSPS